MEMLAMQIMERPLLEWLAQLPHSMKVHSEHHVTATVTWLSLTLVFWGWWTKARLTLMKSMRVETDWLPVFVKGFLFLYAQTASIRLFYFRFSHLHSAPCFSLFLVLNSTWNLTHFFSTIVHDSMTRFATLPIGFCTSKADLWFKGHGHKANKCYAIMFLQHFTVSGTSTLPAEKVISS